MSNCDCNKCCPGPMGNQGPQGPQGLQGVPGNAGLQGQPGQNGAIGPQGPAGLQGPIGVDGPAGAAGAPGAVGAQGIPGSAGLQGQPGQPGQNGAQGAMGPQGAQGLQGIQGVPGDCVQCSPQAGSSTAEFAEVFSIANQTLAASAGENLAGGTVLLEVVRFATPNINVTQSAVSGKIIVNLAGWYDVASGMTGTLNPIPSPLPVWTMSLFKNNVIIPGSTFSNVPLSPAQSSNEITADCYVHFNVGDVLTLSNTSDALLFLSAPSLGTFAQTNSAYLKIQLLQADVVSANPQVNAANAAFLAALTQSENLYVKSSTVNMSQVPADALAAQTAANVLITSIAAANTALLAAASFATPASLAAATATLANFMAASNVALSAANNAVTTLNPANTVILVANAASGMSVGSILVGNSLVAL